MVFAPWHWVIKSAHLYPELIVPMALLTPWRLPLLFAVSGYASRRLFERAGSAGMFLRARAKRLLIPLGFAMAAIVPAEMWVRVMERGYTQGYLHFWLHDYWRIGRFHGQAFPSWEHLWFVAYLAAYSLGLGALLAWRGPTVLAMGTRLAAWLGEGCRLLWTPIAALGTARLALLFVVPEQQGLFTDWAGHAQYLPEFLFGFVLAGAPGLWPALARLRRPTFLAAAAAGIVVAAVESAYPGTAVPPHAVMALDRFARVAMSWTMILLLFDMAERHANYDHRWRRPLAEAVFPAYLVHHPAIVLIAWYSLPLGLGPVAEFALLLAGTAAACALTYFVGRRIGWVRPLIGLGPVARAGRSARGAAPA